MSSQYVTIKAKAITIAPIPVATIAVRKPLKLVDKPLTAFIPPLTLDE